jgi:hypothetical protein
LSGVEEQELLLRSQRTGWFGWFLGQPTSLGHLLESWAVGKRMTGVFLVAETINQGAAKHRRFVGAGVDGSVRTSRRGRAARNRAIFNRGFAPTGPPCGRLGWLKWLGHDPSFGGSTAGFRKELVRYFQPKDAQGFQPIGHSQADRFKRGILDDYGGPIYDYRTARDRSGDYKSRVRFIL